MKFNYYKSLMNISKLSLCALMLLFMGTAAKAQMSAHDYNSPVGWGTVDGTITGGNEEGVMKVTTMSQLKTALIGTYNHTVYIEGEIEITGLISLENVQNKTIYGLPGSALVNSTHSTDKKKSGILSFKNSKNIIIRNVTFKGAGAYDIDGNDNLNLTDCNYVWVDHCDFQDGVDGNFDCNNGSDHISVTWCRFRYLKDPWEGGSGGADDHRFSNLWGGSDSETESEGKLRTTFYSCWWDEGCRERMPRIRFGQVHLLNCLYSSSVANYCIGTGYKCNAYVEKCVFDGVKNPWKNYATSGKYTDYNITMTGNQGAKDEQSHSGSIDYFVPSDHYQLDGYDVSLVDSEVRAYAGATLNVEYEHGVTSAISNPGADGAAVKSVTYYSPSGMKLSEPQKGLNIVVRKTADGRVMTSKVMIK